MEQRDSIPVIIRKCREEKGYTQEKLSQLINKSDKYIGAVESGRVKPPYPVLKEIVCALGMDGNILFYDCMNVEISKAAEIYLRRMDTSTQQLAIDVLQAMANSQVNERKLKKRTDSK